MKSDLRFLVVLLTAIVLSACVMEVPAELIVVTSDLSFSKEGGTKTITFSTNKSWTTISSEPWVKVPSSGPSSATTVEVTVEPNTEYEDRTATVTIIAEDKVASVSIRQSQDNAIIVSQDKVNVPFKGGEFSIAVSSNIGLKVSVEGRASSWISLIQTKGLDETTWSFTVQENTEMTERKGVVVFSGDGIDRRIEVNQDGPFIIYTDASPNCVAYGEDDEVTCLFVKDSTTVPSYILALGSKVSGDNFYAFTDSTGRPYRIVSCDCIFDIYYNDNHTVDLVYSLSDGTFKIKEGCPFKYPITKEMTKAGKVATTRDIILSAEADIVSLLTGGGAMEDAVAGLDDENNFTFRNKYVKSFCADSGVELALAPAGPEIARGAEIAVGTLGVIKALVNDWENRMAENYIGDATPVTNRVVQVKENEVLVNVSLEGTSNGYPLKLGSISGIVTPLTKNNMVFLESSEFNGPITSALDIPMNEFSDMYYRGVVISGHRLSHDNLLDYWYYGETVKHKHLDKLVEMEAPDNWKRKEEDGGMTFFIDVTAESFSDEYDQWGIQIVDEDEKVVVEKYFSGAETKYFSFELTLKNSQLKNNKYWTLPIKKYYAVPVVKHQLNVYRQNEGHEIDFTASMSCPDSSHVHAIDLGLSVKWACCNVGANNPEGYGKYYAWGETETKSEYTEVSYKYAHGAEMSEIYGYYAIASYDYLGSDISGTQYDVAHVKWGGSWRMPTRAECEELINNCDSEWTTINGIGGYMLTSRNNGNSIFLPASGYRYVNDLYGLGSAGAYSCSSSYENASDRFAIRKRCCLSFGTDYIHVVYGGGGRLTGNPVRPVCD